MRGSARVPEQVDRRNIAFVPKMFANDRYNDCPVASLANHRRATAMMHGYDWVTDNDAVVTYFAQCAGVLNLDAILTTVPGLVALDVADRARTLGFAMGGQVPEVVADIFAVNVTDRENVASAIAQGPMWAGIDLYAGDEDDGVAKTAEPQGSPVSGHMLLAWTYFGLGDEDVVYLPTYDTTWVVNWRWFMSRLREAYSIAWA